MAGLWAVMEFNPIGLINPTKSEGGVNIRKLDIGVLEKHSKYMGS